MLPDMVMGSRLEKRVQVRFGGYDRRPDAADGTLFDTEGLSADRTPLLGTRNRRWSLSTGDTNYHATCMLGGEQIVWIANDGLVRTPTMVLCILPGRAQRSLTRFGKNAIIMPDKRLLKLEYDYKDFVAYENLPTATAAAGDTYLALIPGGSTWDERNIPHIYQFNGSTWDDLGFIAPPLEAAVTVSAQTYVTVIGSGRLYDQPAQMNTLSYYALDHEADIDFTEHFKVGDAVTISGCTVQPLNNLTAIIREIEPRGLRFSENVFSLPFIPVYDGPALERTSESQQLNLFRGEVDFHGNRIFYFNLPADMEEGDILAERIDELGELYVELWRDGEFVDRSPAAAPPSAGTEALRVLFTLKADPYAQQAWEYEEPGPILIERKLPELEGIFESNNRLWGWAGSEIFASKLGDPTNFYYFDSTANDAWSWPVESPGDITGAISFDGFPTFFKERERIKVFGAVPAQFQISKINCTGVKPGCSQSLAVVGGALFYLSREGIMADNGAGPRRISDELGTRDWGTGVSGGCGDVFTICLTDGAKSEVFCYDLRRGLWLRDNAERYYGFAESGGLLYGLELTRLVCFGKPENETGWTPEDAVRSLAETNDYTLGEPNAKRVHRVQLRMETAWDTELRVMIQYDGDGVWHEVAELLGRGEKRSFRPSVRLRRCDHFRLRFEAVGGWVLHSMAVETRRKNR